MRDDQGNSRDCSSGLWITPTPSSSKVSVIPSTCRGALPSLLSSTRPSSGNGAAGGGVTSTPPEVSGGVLLFDSPFPTTAAPLGDLPRYVHLAPRWHVRRGLRGAGAL